MRGEGGEGWKGGGKKESQLCGDLVVILVN